MIPVVQYHAPAGHNSNRIDRPPRESRQLDYTKPGDARDLRNIGGQRHVIPLRKGGQHGLEGADATFDVETADMIPRSSHRADAEPLRRVGIDLAVAMTGNQDLDPMPAAEKRYHEMLAVPHGNDYGLLRLYSLIKIGGLDGKAAGAPYQTKIFGGQQTDEPLHHRRPRDAS